MTQEVAQIIGQNIVVRRRLLNMNQDTLAGVLKIPHEQIRKIEQGAEALSVDQLFTLARFFNCSIDALCGFQPINESLAISLVSAADILSRELPESLAHIRQDLQCALYKSLKLLALTVNIAKQKLPCVIKHTIN